jgi:hypothetical protein
MGLHDASILCRGALAVNPILSRDLSKVNGASCEGCVRTVSDMGPVPQPEVVTLQLAKAVAQKTSVEVHVSGHTDGSLGGGKTSHNQLPVTHVTYARHASTTVVEVRNSVRTSLDSRPFGKLCRLTTPRHLDFPFPRNYPSLPSPPHCTQPHTEYGSPAICGTALLQARTTLGNHVLQVKTTHEACDQASRNCPFYTPGKVWVGSLLPWASYRGSHHPRRDFPKTGVFRTRYRFWGCLGSTRFNLRPAKVQIARSLQ